MKILKSLFIFLICISFASCSTDDGNSSSSEFRATIDGASFNGEAIANIIAGGLSITGENSNGDVIILSVQGFDTNQNTYDLATSTSIGGAVYLENGDNNSFGSLLEGGSGSLTITEYDQDNNLISGEFNFVAIRESFNNDMTEIVSESVTVTSGSFSNIEVSGIPESNNDNVFNALIDGQEYSPNSILAFESTIGGETSIIINTLNTSTGQNIAINFSGEILIGRFDLESFPTPNNYSATYNPNINGGTTLNTPITGSGSTVTIDEYDESTGVLVGSFEFTAGDFTGQSSTTFEITEGEFSVTIQ